MFHNDAPLLVNPKPSWHKLRWFAEFVAAMPQYEKNITETARLAIAARDFLLSGRKNKVPGSGLAFCPCLALSPKSE